MMNITMEYGEFTYESEPDQGDDVTKMMHYVFWNQEYIGMVNKSPYENVSYDEFKEFCETWIKQQEMSATL